MELQLSLLRAKDDSSCTGNSVTLIMCLFFPFPPSHLLLLFLPVSSLSAFLPSIFSHIFVLWIALHPHHLCSHHQHRTSWLALDRFRPLPLKSGIIEWPTKSPEPPPSGREPQATGGPRDQLAKPTLPLLHVGRLSPARR